MSSTSSPAKKDDDTIERDGNPPPSAQAQSDGAGSRDDLQVDAVRRYLAEKLGFYETDKPKEAPVVKVLEDRTLESIAKYILSDRCKKVITLAGAGISTSAGIPDFRSPGSGLYHNLQKYNLPEPQAIFEINFFRSNPKPFFVLAKELFPGSFKPTKSHYFIRLLNEKGLLLRHYTQNIDTLERGAGIPEHKIVEAHGTFYSSHCLECRKPYSLEWIKEHIFADNIPICTDCPGVVKPDITFFGESLPSRFEECLQEDLHQADVLLVMGSSLEVQPFASLIDMVPSWCPRLLINRERTGQRSAIMRLLGMGGGLQFDEGHRDVAWLGDCDEGCQALADKLGWGEELCQLVQKEHQRLDLEGASALHAPLASLSPHSPLTPHSTLSPHSPVAHQSTITPQSLPHSSLPAPLPSLASTPPTSVSPEARAHTHTQTHDSPTQL